MSDLFVIPFVGFDYYSPHWLWGLLLVPVFFFIYDGYAGKKQNFLRFSQLEEKQESLATDKVKYYVWGIRGGFALAFCCFIGALARPYNTSIDPPEIDYKNGIDIILSLDISGSMLAQDFEPNRLEAAKKVAEEFVDHRKGDRIGLVLYEGEAFTACPATLDYAMLKQTIASAEPGMVMTGGTAIGDGLGIAVTRLRSDSLKSKVIILLTDGSNNAGSITPEEAAQLAAAKHCTVYTIGVGSNGMAPTPVLTPSGISYENMPVDIDESTLKYIAMTTNGKYFRATDANSLKSIYAEIDQLEKRKMEDSHFGKEPPVLIAPYLLWGTILLIAAWIFQQVKFKLDE